MLELFSGQVEGLILIGKIFNQNSTKLLTTQWPTDRLLKKSKKLPLYGIPKNNRKS